MWEQVKYRIKRAAQLKAAWGLPGDVFKLPEGIQGWKFDEEGDPIFPGEVKPRSGQVLWDNISHAYSMDTPLRMNKKYMVKTADSSFVGAIRAILPPGKQLPDVHGDVHDGDVYYSDEMKTYVALQSGSWIPVVSLSAL